MIDNKDFDFVKEKFESDGIETPEKLSADNMMRMLGEQPDRAASQREQRPIRKRPWFRPVVAAAACAALVVGLVPLMNFNFGSQQGSDAASGELQYFANYDELTSKIKSMSEENGHVLYSNKEDSIALGNGDAVTETEDMAEAPAASSETGNAVGQTRPESHSETYTQVEGVDEADIVKTDGKYIYFSSYEENQIIIARAAKGKARRVAAIGSGKIGSFIEDMYVSGDKLIVIGYDSEKEDEFTTVTVFDVANPENPKMLRKYSQSGDLLSSRLIGSNLCLVTNDYIYVRTPSGFIPRVYYNDEVQQLPIGDICCFPGCTQPAYTIVGCMDISSEKSSQKTIKTKAVLGGSSEIYCNNENLYITGTVFNNGGYGDFWTNADIQTNILKVSIRDGNVKFKKSAVVHGTVNNQFSMDESDGYFKVAVTDSADGQDTNNLYIMDKNMKEVGCVRNFARGEHIEAVRYIKDKAYVITYEQVDPLFIIDLADPTDPVIEGHVKITGFSTLLVPAGDDHLLGLGFSTEELEDPEIDMEATDGVKLSLFDITDPSNPTVADAKAFRGMDSEVQYNHKALLVGPNASYYAIPFCEYGKDFETETNGILTFKVQNGKLAGFHKNETNGSVMRCIYIGDYIYGVCDDDSIEGFKAQ